jgi:hypothetical protein
MTVTPFRTRTRPPRTQPVGEPEQTPESQEVARLVALLADPRKAPYREELEFELRAARARLVELTATTVLAA